MNCWVSDHHPNAEQFKLKVSSMNGAKFGGLNRLLGLLV